MNELCGNPCLSSPSVTFAAQTKQHPPDPFVSTISIMQKKKHHMERKCVTFLVLTPSPSSMTRDTTDTPTEHNDSEVSYTYGKYGLIISTGCKHNLDLKI